MPNTHMRSRLGIKPREAGAVLCLSPFCCRSIGFFLPTGLVLLCFGLQSGFWGGGGLSASCGASLAQRCRQGALPGRGALCARRFWGSVIIALVPACSGSFLRCSVKLFSSQPTSFALVFWFSAPSHRARGKGEQVVRGFSCRLELNYDSPSLASQAGEIKGLG